MAVRPGRDSGNFRRLAAALRRERRGCWLCGQAIDYDAPKGHPDAFTVDHKLPLSTHPHLAEVYGNLDAAHDACNKGRGNGMPKAGLGDAAGQW